FMLEDARVPVLVTHERLRGDFPSGSARVVTVDGERSAAPAPKARRAGPDDLAYVIYTSGSTGRPKGGMVHPRAIVNHLLWMAAAHPMGPEDVVLQKTPISFDASVWELFLPLMTGARLAMAPPGAHRDPAALVEAVAAESTTVLQLVPSVAEALLGEPELKRA